MEYLPCSKLVVLAEYLVRLSLNRALSCMIWIESWLLGRIRDYYNAHYIIKMTELFTCSRLLYVDFALL